ncbi:MAG: hypothetical protein PHN31_02665 [Candidatus Gracilibacteria bacterium]|nr:hypothetical protein [Candidatus Gracilibacteria bacterium]
MKKTNNVVPIIIITIIIICIILWIVISKKTNYSDSNFNVVSNNNNLETEIKENKDPEIINNNNQDIKKIIEPETKKAITYEDISNLSGEASLRIEIKGGLKATRNTIENIIGNCNFLEGETDYLMEEGKKVKQERKNVEDIIIENYEQDNKLTDSSDFKALLQGTIQGKYKLIENKDFDKTKFSSPIEFYEYFGHYLFSLKDEKSFEIYSSLYMEELRKENLILHEDYILPLIAGVYYHNKSCKTYIKDNFILY